MLCGGRMLPALWGVTVGVMDVVPPASHSLALLSSLVSFLIYFTALSGQEHTV